MSDQKNTVTYELDVQTGAAQMAISQVLQSVKGTMFAGLSEPLSTFQAASGEIGAQQARMLESQRITAGFANLATVANEYTQRGFYQQLAFGTQPQFGAAGLRNEMMVQQMAASMPFQAGIPSTAAEMRHFSDTVMQPFQGLVGFQQPFGEALAGAQAAGLQRVVGGPQQLATAMTQLGALVPFNQGYNVPGREAGAVYTQLLAQGVPVGNAQGTYQEVVRAQNAGVPTQQALGATGRYERDISMRQTFGLLGSQGRSSYSAGDAVQDQITGELAYRSLKSQGFSVSSQFPEQFSSTLEELNMMLGNDVVQRQKNIQTAGQLTAGAMFKNVDKDLIVGQQAAQSSRQVAEEERSASYIATREILSDAMTGPGLLRTAARGLADRFAPSGARDWIDRAMGVPQGTGSQLGITPRLDAAGNPKIDALALDVASGKFGSISASPADRALRDAEAKRQSGDMTGAAALLAEFADKNLPKDLKDEHDRNAPLGSVGGYVAQLSMAAKTGDVGRASPTGAVYGELHDVVEKFADRQGSTARAMSMANIENAAMERAGTNVFKTAEQSRAATRLELDVLRGAVKPEQAMNEFARVPGVDSSAKNTFSSQLMGLAGKGLNDIDPARARGFGEFESVGMAKALTQDPNLMRGVLPGAIAALKSAEGRGTQNESYISRLSAIKPGDPGAMRQYNDIMQNADPKAGGLMRQMLESQVSAGQFGGGTPDFGTFAGAAISAGDALIKLSKLIPGLTPAKGQN